MCEFFWLYNSKKKGKNIIIKVLNIFVNLSACIYSIWDCSDPTRFPLIPTAGVLKYWLCYWQILALFFGRLANINRLLEKNTKKQDTETKQTKKRNRQRYRSAILANLCELGTKQNFKRGKKSCPWYTNNKRVRDSLSTNSPSLLAWSKKKKQKQKTNTKQRKRTRARRQWFGSRALPIKGCHIYRT